MSNMDHGKCNVIFLDKRAKGVQTFKKDDIEPRNGRPGTQKHDLNQEEPAIQDSIRAILDTFNEGGYHAYGRLTLVLTFHSICLPQWRRLLAKAVADGRPNQSNANFGPT